MIDSGCQAMWEKVWLHSSRSISPPSPNLTAFHAYDVTSNYATITSLSFYPVPICYIPPTLAATQHPLKSYYKAYTSMIN